MFHRFSAATRKVVYAAHREAQAAGAQEVEPWHLSLALLQCCPDLIERCLPSARDLETLRQEMRERYAGQAAAKQRHTLFSHASQSAFVHAYEEAKRVSGNLSPATAASVHEHLGHPEGRPGWAARLLRRLLGPSWKVEPQHLLWALLGEEQSELAAFLGERGLTQARVRERLFGDTAACGPSARH